MAHQPGDPIDIASYNDIISQVNVIFGTGTGSSGYGGSSTNVSVTDLSSKIIGDTIDNQDWLDLRNAQEDVATHQGVALPATLPLVSNLQNADLAQAFEDPDTGLDPGKIDSAANLAQIVTNKALTGGESFSVANKLTSARGIPWSISLLHEFTVDFGNENNARHYFNTGGDLRISATRTGGTVAAPNPLLPGASASVQNAAWTLLLNSNSPYIFTSSDYFALTTNFLPKQNVSDAGTYAANTWTITVKADSIPGVLGGKGSVIRFRTQFNDAHTNSGGFGIEDFVDGTFTSIIDERRAVGVFNKTSMIITYATTIALSGS